MMNPHDDPPDDILDTSRLCFEGDFDEQVEHILQLVRLSRAEVQNLRLLFEDLECALQQLAPGCQVMPFGSIITGLGIRTSDADCFIRLPNNIVPDKHIVIMAKKVLQQHYKKFTNLFAIVQCKVPIVKFLHIPTNCQCDVSFKSPSGVRNSELIGYLLHMDKRALPLAILIKYWSKVYKFTGTNLMANYALTILVIFYLQLKSILPPVCKLQNEVESFMVDDWETAFNVQVHHETKNCESLYELMGGFFKYYSEFDFEHLMVSPFIGQVISKQCFKNVHDLPPDFFLYKHNVSSNLSGQIRLDTCMCIQDPFDHSRNCAVAIFPKLMLRILSHFKFAAVKFEQKNEANFLKAIFTEDPTVVKNTELPKKKPIFHGKIKKNKYNGHAGHFGRAFQAHIRNSYVPNNRRRGKR